MDDEVEACLEYLNECKQYQDYPEVGVFWYDVNKDYVFNVYSLFNIEASWIYSNILHETIRTAKYNSEKYWNLRTNGNNNLKFYEMPRGRVIEVKDRGFRVYVGDWLDNYPNAKKDILHEFQLLESETTFVIDSRWDIGSNFLDGFYNFD